MALRLVNEESSHDGCDVPTPTQQRVLDELFDRGGPRPEFDPQLGRALRRELEEQLEPLVAHLADDDRITIAKRSLGLVHSCEGLWVAEEAAGFAWSAPAARGTVAHKAVELSITLARDVAPLDLVDLAIDRLIESGGDWGPRTWLLGAPEPELAELRGAASDWLVKFQDTFPHPQRRWRPRLESALTVDLLGGRVALRGKVDLALGKAEGNQARVLIIDFKTGRPSRVHIDDLRFYALLETLRVGVPPFRVATFSLDSGTWQSEDIDEEVLAATIRRVVAGARKLVELSAVGEDRAIREPVLTPGPACRWCPAAAQCPAPREHEDPFALEFREDADDDGDG